jgi:hypothetical protein
MIIMLTEIVDSIRRKRAGFIHEVSFIREMARDDAIADSIDKSESMYVRETLDDIKNANQMVTEMTAALEKNDLTDEDEAEINYLLEATEDVSFDEMIMNAKKK